MPFGTMNIAVYCLLSHMLIPRVPIIMTYVSIYTESRILPN